MRSRFKFDELLFQSKFCLPLSDNRGNSFQRINWRSSRVIGYVVKSCCNSVVSIVSLQFEFSCFPFVR